MRKKKELDNKESKFCECGCGEVVTSGRKFKQGHHMRVTKDHPMRRPEVLEKYFLGDKNSSKRPEVREKIGNSSRNRKPSKESREKMRQAKLKNPVKAHLNTKRSELTKQKIKESHKKRNETKHNKIKELIKKGYYNSEIVKKLRTSSATVTKIKKELNLTAVHNRSRLAPNPDNLT